VLREYASEVPKEIRRIALQGGLLAFDLSGFGELAKEAQASFKTFDLTGSEIFDSFLVDVQTKFVEVLHNYGFFHYRVEGDGFIAAIPLNDISGDDDVAQRYGFVTKCDLLLRELHTFFELKCHPLGFQSQQRASILFGSYCFGKIVGRTVSAPQIFGSSLINLVRLRDHRNAKRKAGVYLSCSIDDSEFIGKVLGVAWSSEMVTATLKEYRSQVVQFHFKQNE